MPRSYRLYLKDIQWAIKRIQTVIQPLDETTRNTDDTHLESVLFNLITIGEAAKNIPTDIRALTPEIDWSEIGRFRDFLVHHYFGIERDRIWKIIQTDLPELSQNIEKLLDLLDSSSPTDSSSPSTENPQE
jgi:uncharacterized protein with HEPN domain